LGDLNSFRLYFNRYLAQNNGNMPGMEMPNRDGSSGFRAFKCAEIPGFAIAMGGNEAHDEAT
jgi:hypothetical protein